MLTPDAASTQFTLSVGRVTATRHASSATSAPHAAAAAAPAMQPVGSSGTTRDAGAVPDASVHAAVPDIGPVAVLRSARYRCLLAGAKPGAVAAAAPEATRC